jgi:hypothetical protein
MFAIICTTGSGATATVLFVFTRNGGMESLFFPKRCVDERNVKPLRESFCLKRYETAFFTSQQ